MNKCTTLYSPVLAQFPQPSATEFWPVLISLIFLAGLVALGLRMAVYRKQLNEKDPPERRLLPDPLRTEPVKVYVEDGIFKEGVKQLRDELRREFEERLMSHDKRVQEKVADLSKNVDGIKAQHAEWRDTASENFRAIEGALGGLKARADANNALASGANQTIQRLSENLPGLITAAVRRGRT